MDLFCNTGLWDPLMYKVESLLAIRDPLYNKVDDTDKYKLQFQVVHDC